jgi:hemerythrin-like domain-containing protein
MERVIMKNLVDETVYQNVFENLKGETNAHWLCVALNDKLNETHDFLLEIARTMQRNLDDVDQEKRESLEEIIELANGFAEYIRIEQYRHIDKMREFSGLREYGKGMKL